MMFFFLGWFWNIHTSLLTVFFPDAIADGFLEYFVEFGCDQCATSFCCSLSYFIITAYFTSQSVVGIIYAVFLLLLLLLLLVLLSLLYAVVFILFYRFMRCCCRHCCCYCCRHCECNCCRHCRFVFLFFSVAVVCFVCKLLWIVCNNTLSHIVPAFCCNRSKRQGQLHQATLLTDTPLPNTQQK